MLQNEPFDQDAFNSLVILNQQFEGTGFLDCEQLSDDLHPKEKPDRLGGRAMDSKSFAELKRKQQVVLSHSEKSMMHISVPSAHVQEELNQGSSEESEGSVRNLVYNPKSQERSQGKRSEISPLRASDQNPRRQRPHEHEATQNMSSRRNSKEIQMR